MKKTEFLYHIYHIPGKKIGITCDINKRVTKQQGYQIGEYEVLDSSYDVNYISEREIELQLIYGYEIDQSEYKYLDNKLETLTHLNQMNINVTDKTVTFPCPVNKLKGHLMDNLGIKIKTDLGEYLLTPDLAQWITDNAMTSMFNPARAYIYNKSLSEHCLSLGKKPPAKSYNNQQIGNTYFDPGNVYDLIRLWAEQRGIYKDGDSKTQYIKLQEESGELARAILKNNRTELIDAIGDMMVVLTNLAALEGLKVEDCVTSAYSVISERKGSMINGTFVKNDSKTNGILTPGIGINQLTSTL